ncbi:PTS transporter subunit EIIB [Chitinilyticum aquatile]|uniref:PTS transporter subunit EIIB n=1 Tax=Chitinilyticum aquatile TaxID=362520 RepID=UPI00040E65C4|nr:PTS transporter subunit EIIB [Chitinilyticum aquatile]
MFGSLFKKKPASEEEAVAASAQPVGKTGESALLLALGGPDNLRSAGLIAVTRIRIELKNPALVDKKALRQAGVLAVALAAPGVYHLIIGLNAKQLAATLP